MMLMRPSSRHPTASALLALLVVVLVAYCARQQRELNTLKGTLQQSRELIDAGNNPRPFATRNTKVSYVTSFWAKAKGEKKVNPHRREVEAALLANIHNQHFDQVVVFLDREDDAESCFDFHQQMSDLNRQVFSTTAEESNALLANKVKCVDVQTGQPSYYQMFNYALSDVVTGDVVVLANADMAYDETMSLARSLNPEVLLALGTRGFSSKMTPDHLKKIYKETIGIDHMRGFHSSEADRCAVTRTSWDTYIFHKSKLMGRLKEENFKRLIQTNEWVPFYMNEIGAENAALWAIEQAYPFSSTYNACYKIHSWHFHLAKKTHKDRTTLWLRERVDDASPYHTNPHRVPEPYAFPGKIVGETPDCVRTETCFLSYSNLES